MLLVQLLLLAEQAHHFQVVGTSERQFGLPPAERFQTVHDISMHTKSQIF